MKCSWTISRSKNTHLSMISAYYYIYFKIFVSQSVNSTQAVLCVCFFIFFSKWLLSYCTVLWDCYYYTFLSNYYRKVVVKTWMGGIKSSFNTTTNLFHLPINNVQCNNGHTYVFFMYFIFFFLKVMNAFRISNTSKNDLSCLLSFCGGN